MMSEQIECSRAEAAALETVFGILADPQCFFIEHTGTGGQTWQVRERVNDAQAILEAVRKGMPGQPDHPMLACLYALEAHTSLRKWQTTGDAPAFVRVPGSHLCRLIYGKAIHIPSPVRFHVSDFLHAAALIVCGFEPLSFDGERIAFPAESATFPEIPREAFRAAAAAATTRRAPGIDASGVQLGSHAAGEHPWCYAVQCLANDGAVRASQKDARKDPIVLTRGKGMRSSVITMSLLEPGCRDSSLRDAARRHNKGL